MSVSGTCICCKMDYEDHGLDLNIISEQSLSYVISVFPTGKGVFQQDNSPCHRARIVFEWLQEQNTKFQLKSQQSNSMNFYTIQRIRGDVERQLKAKKQPCCNTPDLRNCCLNMCTICLQPPTKDSCHLFQSGLQLFCGQKIKHALGGHKVLALQCI